MNSLHGLNVHDKADGGREWSAQEQADFWKHFETVRPTSSLFLNRRDRALEAKRRVPECKVIFRQYIEEDNKQTTEGNLWNKRSIQWHVDKFAPLAAGNLIINMWNEPQPPEEQLENFAKTYAKLMDAFGTLGIPLVGPNFNVGTPNESDRVLKLLSPLWDAFDRWHDVHFFGTHEYGSHYGMLFNQPGHPYSVYPWRVGRYVELIAPWIEKNGHKIPYVIFTEFGADSAGDGQQNKRGYRNYWTGKYYAGQVIPAIQKVKRYYVIGFNVYSEGNTNDWPDFNIMGDTDYHTEIETATKDGRLAPVLTVPPVVEPPPVTYPQLPTLDDPRWQLVIAAPSGDYANVRSKPDKTGDVIGKINPVQELFVLTQESHDAWLPVKIPMEGKAPQLGWVNSTVISFIEVPADPPTKTVEISRDDALELARHFTALGLKWTEIANR